MGKYLADSYDAALRENADLKARLAEMEGALRIALNQDGDHSPNCKCKLCKAEARLADMTAEADSWRANARDSGVEARRYKARLAEAEALLREARMGVKNSAVQFGYPYTEYVDRIDAFLAADRMLDLTPVGPGETVDDALSRQKSPIWEREPPHCPTCDCPTAADQPGEAGK